MSIGHLGPIGPTGTQGPGVVSQVGPLTVPEPGTPTVISPTAPAVYTQPAMQNVVDALRTNSVATNEELAKLAARVEQLESMAQASGWLRN